MMDVAMSNAWLLSKEAGLKNCQLTGGTKLTPEIWVTNHTSRTPVVKYQLLSEKDQAIGKENVNPVQK